MNHIRTIIKKGYLTIAIAIMAVTPLATFVDVSADDGCVAPPASSYGTPGVHAPTGSEAKAFVYQCGDANPYKDQWLSSKYIYYPDSDAYKPRDPIVYYYNKNTGQYDYTKWVYDNPTNDYRAVNRSTATPPADAQVVGHPDPKPAPTPTSNSGSAGTASLASNAAAGPNAGGNGSTTTNSNTDNNTTINNNNNVTVGNNINSTATSGNATVHSNTTAGNATSGDVITQADVTNMLQSSSNAVGAGTNVAMFTYNIDGDINGDLLFDPAAISRVQGDATTNSTLNNNLTINNTSNATINNNLDLASTSGNATVANNTNGGDATSGNAKTIANIVNSIRSSITAGKSFVGTINITGNLNGDILLPDNFVDTLIASNVPTVPVSAPGSTNTSTSTTTNTTTVNNTNNQNVNNNINSTAQSGTAKVRGNTTGGSATSGNAKTNVTAFNLTGSNVVAKNSILVYVNVLGKWTGLIVNAPVGATAALIGGNVTQNKTVTNTATLNNTNNQQINNNVNVSANSGNATVRGNTTGGNAKAGDAETAVNISNVEDSTLDLSDWFGILYINVFGTWNGSFGMNTSAGDVANTTSTYYVGNASKLVRYAATTNTITATPAARTTASAPAASSSTSSTGNLDQGSVLAAQTKRAATSPVVASQTPQASTVSKLWIPAFGVLAFISILGIEKLVARRKAQ